MKYLAKLALVALAIAALQGCDHAHVKQDSHEAHRHGDAHSASSRGQHQADHSRPTNQVAVVTVWAESEVLESTASFYENVLGLQRVGSSTEPYLFDADGTFVVVMEGRLEQPRDIKRRWPMFALSVPDLDQSVELLRNAGTELPWGVEEFGAPQPSSLYVMFHDPAGNLMEIVEWL